MKYALPESGQEAGTASIIFGAQCTVLDGTRCAFKLKNALRKDIGIEIELKRDIFDGDGRAFLTAAAQRGNFEITAGAGWRF